MKFELTMRMENADKLIFKHSKVTECDNLEDAFDRYTLADFQDVDTEILKDFNKHNTTLIQLTARRL